MFDLHDKVAVVTGGNGGLGLGMARGLARAGAHVVIAARNADKSASALREIEQAGGAGSVALVDVADERSVAALMGDVKRQHGRLNILINNAGINIRKPVHELSLAEWRQVIDVNLTSTYLCCHAAYPLFKLAGGGKVINIGSMLSIFGASFAPAYAASKGGVVQFTKATAIAWAPDNIQVNAILPGWIDTELTQAARKEIGGLNERVLARTPAGRWGTTQDMEGIAVFLASQASNFITGTAIPVDGGYSVSG